MKRKSLLLLSCLVLLFTSLFLFRDAITALGTKALLHKSLSCDVSHQRVVAKKGRVSIEGLHLSDADWSITLDQVEFNLHLGKIVSSPKSLFTLYREGFSNWIGAFLALKQYGMDLSIERGELSIGEERFYLSYRNGERLHEVGLLQVSLDPSQSVDPFLQIRFNMRGNQLTTQMKLEEVPTDRFLQLATFVFPETLRGFEGAEGEVEIVASAIFEADGSIDELSTRFSCEQLRVHHEETETAIQIEQLSGDLSYPEGAANAGLPVWKKLLASVTLENGTVRCGRKFTLSKMEGSLALDPRVDPSMLLTGVLASEEKPLFMKLEGNGAVHENHAYWLEFGLNLDDLSGTECDAFLSICRPQVEELVVQLEANHLLPQQVEMFKGYFSKTMPRLKEWQVDSGSFGGKLVALFDKGNLTHFEIQDLIGEHVVLVKEEDHLRINRIEGEGRLFEKIHLEIELPTDHFFGLFSDDFKQIYSQLDRRDSVHLTTELKYGKSGVDTLGSVSFDFGGESLQFGFQSPRHFPSGLEEIKEGWVRSEKLTRILYAPFLSHYFEDLELYGEIDLVGTYNGRDIEFLLQIEDFLVNHTLLDIKADSIGERGMTEGRARFAFNTQTGEMQGSLPLRGAAAYDRTYGLVTRDLHADLLFKKTGLEAVVQKGTLSFDGQELIRDCSMILRMNEEVVLDGFKGAIALNTDKSYILNIPHLDRETVAISLFDGKNDLFHFKGKRGDLWSGTVLFPKSKETFAVEALWDRRNGRSTLSLKADEKELLLKQVGGEVYVESLRLGDTHGKGVFSPSSGGFLVPHFEFSNREIAVEGTGHFFLDLPTTEKSFSVRSELTLDVETKEPLPLQFSCQQPIKFAYSPDRGYFLSNLTVNVADSTFSFEGIEHLFSTKKTDIHNCRFHVSEELLSSLIDHDLVPGLVNDFRFSDALLGNANVVISSGKTQFSGRIEKGASWAEEGKQDLLFSGNIEKGKSILSLKEEGMSEGLTFITHLGVGQFEFQEVKGSLGRLGANLKSDGKKGLKGNLTVDFALLQDLFRIPLVRLVDLWGAGSGFRFEGRFKPRKELADWGFKGKVKGDHFECAGVVLRSLEAKVEVEPGQISVENVDVTDDAGKMWIGEGALMRAGSDWIFAFPLVEIRSFQPSFLQRIHGPEKQIKPLQIKSATLRDVRGRLDDVRSITGSGNLRFTNVSKDGERILPINLPQFALQRLGLDGQLFVPAKGELDYIVQNGRLYLREIRSWASENSASEFTPPRNGVMGYLDLNGDLFLDFNVRQRLSRSAPSTLSLKVRGHYDDPEITIK